MTKPRKLKKVLRKWTAGDSITKRERVRLLRFVNRHRRELGEPPVRRMADGRVSLLELP